MAIEKTIQTRILNKVDTLENWSKSTLKIKQGEICIATVAASAGTGLAEPVCMIKIGTAEEKTFSELPWSFYAKASDVAEWAKAANKPTYAANEITGIADYIKDYVEETMGITVDTNTVYRTVKVSDYEYKLQSKGALDADTAWADVADSNIVIPDMTQRIKAIEDKFADETVAAEITAAITGLKLAETYAAKVHDHTASEITDFATEVAKVKVANADKADAAGKVDNALTVKVGGADVVFDGSAAQTADVDAAIEAAINAIPEQTDYTVTIAETTDGLADGIAKKYTFTQNGAEIGSINLAKELVVTAGSVKEVAEAGKPYADAVVGDKYIELVIANQTEPIYVPAKDLVDIYTAASGAAEVQVAISNTNEVSATLTDAVKEKLNKAHTHAFADSDVEDAISKKHAHTFTDADVEDAISKEHTHTFVDTDVEDAITKKHAHTFIEAELNKIADGDVAKWNIAAQKADDNAGAIEAINNDETGILAQAKAYANSLNHEDTKYTAAADGGLKLDENNAFSIDDSITWIFDCGGSGVTA